MATNCRFMLVEGLSIINVSLHLYTTALQNVGYWQVPAEKQCKRHKMFDQIILGICFTSGFKNAFRELGITLWLICFQVSVM